MEEEGFKSTCYQCYQLIFDEIDSHASMFQLETFFVNVYKRYL